MTTHSQSNRPRGQRETDMSKRVTVENLKDQIGTEYPREVLYCPNCFEEYSANAGDYWNAPKDMVFKHCRLNMRLGVKVTTYRDIVRA